MKFSFLTSTAAFAQLTSATAVEMPILRGAVYAVTDKTTSEAAEVERSTVGPDYTIDPAWNACTDCEKGERFELYMPIANTTFNCEPEDFPFLKEMCQSNCGQEYGPPGTRNITVIIPDSYNDGDDAAVLIDIEGTDWTRNTQNSPPLPTPDGGEVAIQDLYSNLMDNLIGASNDDRSLPPFVYVAVGLAGPGSAAAFGDPDNCGDGEGTPRADELATVSDRYANFIGLEVLPYIENHPDIIAKYPNFHFTDDPVGRVVTGQSNGGVAAFKMVFFRPDLFGNMFGYSPAFNRHGNNLTSDEIYPLDNAEFWVQPPEGQALIESTPVNGKGRYYLNANQNDLGSDNACIAGYNYSEPRYKYDSILVGNNESAKALAEKGHEVKFVYGLDACHTDPKFTLQEAPNAVLWAFDAWKKKLEGVEPSATPDVPTSGVVDKSQASTIIGTLLIVVAAATM